MFLRKLSFALLPLLAFVLVACDSDLDTYSGDEVYTDVTHDFEITPPEGWVDSEPQTPNALVTFVNADGDTNADGEAFHSNIGVVFEEVEGMEFDQYIELSEANLIEIIPGAEILSGEPTEVSRNPAQLSLVTFEDGGFDVKTMQLITMKDEVIYVVTAASLESTFDDHEEVFRNALDSFSFN